MNPLEKLEVVIILWMLLGGSLAYLTYSILYLLTKPKKKSRRYATKKMFDRYGNVW